MMRPAAIGQCGVMAILLKFIVFITIAVSYVYRLYTTHYLGLRSSASCLNSENYWSPSYVMYSYICIVSNVLLKVYIQYLLYGSVFSRAVLQCAWYGLCSVHCTLKSL